MFKAPITWPIVLLQILCFAIFVRAEESAAKPSLNVALFGYIPDGDVVEAGLKKKFESLNTGYSLNLTLLDPYHDTDDGMASLQHFKEFDIVETDLCRLDDLVAQFGGLDALPSTWTWYPSADSCVGGARIVTNSDQKSYTLPHWICENFFVCWAKNDTAKAGNVRDTADSTRYRPILGDFWGTSGLGELYANALVDLYGVDAAEKRLRELAKTLEEDRKLDPKADSIITGLAEKLPRQFREHLSFYHNHGELYAYAFATNRKAAYIGYSETLFYTELATDSLSSAPVPTQLTPKDLTVRPLTIGPGKGTPSWVDGFVIPKGKLESKKAIIEKFLQFIITPEAYECFAQPEPRFAVVNLLPAYATVYQNATANNEPLLTTFRDKFDASFPVFHSEVWRGMKAAGKILETELFPTK